MSTFDQAAQEARQAAKQMTQAWLIREVVITCQNLFCKLRLIEHNRSRLNAAIIVAYPALFQTHLIRGMNDKNKQA